MEASQLESVLLVDLDECVLGALELLTDEEVPQLDLGHLKRPLVVGSGNAIATGRILFADTEAVFADESTYQKVLETSRKLDGAVIISASGGKHAPSLIEYLQSKGLETHLITCRPNAEAEELLGPDNVVVFPSRTEPYTYNTSTYMSMIIGRTKEDPKGIHEFIKTKVTDALSGIDFSRYDAFFILVPAEFDLIRVMLKTKFVELFGRRFGVDVFTLEQAKHATTTVEADNELFISFGVDPNEPFEEYDALWGENRLAIPLPEKNADFAAIMAISYYTVGKLQEAKPAWFKESIGPYCEKVSEVFGQTIRPLVE